MRVDNENVKIQDQGTMNPMKSHSLRTKAVYQDITERKDHKKKHKNTQSEKKKEKGSSKLNGEKRN